ncbi:hypothetical protein Sango_1040500 [Sesamum angolense]|uniref:Transposase-associated domain-containing protein n=1 Tax=Sesamum angolense TaxID=2727404 RepID=A0AAE1X0H4_9LAMI|nr:hypothetical protein Sango_1040500 [Sesamum angolense]
MYNKNLSGRAGLTPEFEDGVKTFIEWAKVQSRHMDGDKIRCPCRKYKNTKFGTPDEVGHHLLSEEPTSAGHVEGNYPQWGDKQHMDWAQRMVFYAVGASYFVSSHECVPDDEGDYYSMKKLVKNLGLPVEKIHACTSLLEGETTSEQVPYDVLRYLPPTPHLQRLYSLRATAEHMMWHATHQTEEGSMCHPSEVEAWKHFVQMYPDFAEEPRNVRLGLCTNDFAPHGQDLKIICNRLELEFDERRPNVMPKAVYTLGKEQKRRVCEWIRGLKFPDGYASNLARWVDMTKLRMHGMKSHDCHVFK